MKILILGGGRIGLATVHYLVSRPEVKHLTLVDLLEAQLLKAEQQISHLHESRKLELTCFDLSRLDLLTEFMKNYDLVAAALPRTVTRTVILAAIDASKPLICITQPNVHELTDLLSLLENEQAV